MSGWGGLNKVVEGGGDSEDELRGGGGYNGGSEGGRPGGEASGSGDIRRGEDGYNGGTETSGARETGGDGTAGGLEGRVKNLVAVLEKRVTNNAW